MEDHISSYASLVEKQAQMAEENRKAAAEAQTFQLVENDKNRDLSKQLSAAEDKRALLSLLGSIGSAVLLASSIVIHAFCL